MRLACTLLLLLYGFAILAYADDVDPPASAEQLAQSFDTAVKHLGKLPHNGPTARVSDWREQRVIEVDKTSINVVRFVECVDREIIGQTFESTGVVTAPRSGYAEKETLYVVVTPISRPWESYMATDEKREYGRMTGWRDTVPKKRVESDADRHRDKQIETDCKRRKDRLENILVKVKRPQTAEPLESDAHVRITFRVRDLTVAAVAPGAPQKLCITNVEADLVSLEPLKEGRPPDVSMFGLGAVGDRFVFVVDFSGSSTVLQDDIRQALTQSIDALEPSRLFEVIVCYSVSEPKERFITESFASELTKAVPAAKRKFASWIGRKSPRGQTEPLAALKRAIELKPDAVYFLSDGVFDNAVVDEIAKSNRGGVPIHCVVFDEKIVSERSGAPRQTDGSKRMQALSTKTKGKTKVVTKSDLGS